MPEQNKKLAGFEALYKVDQEKRRQRDAKGSAAARAVPTPDGDNESAPKTDQEKKKESQSESNIVSNITPQTNADVFEPTTFKADRRKVKALKRLALDLDPARKLQDLFDEALTDILTKYGRTVE